MPKAPLLELSERPESPRRSKHFIGKNIENIKIYQERVASVSPRDKHKSKTPWKRFNFDKASSPNTLKSKNRFTSP